ncbi:MAG: hypothetical protein EXR69_01365 [Myxococcales bacterium]|nr:hypothetical protein [Myxococcales bacterium]
MAQLNHAPASAHGSRLLPFDHPHRRHWGPVTVRIVWDLVAAGIRPRPQVVREVREHALLCLGTHADTIEAEDTASVALIDWLGRRDGRYAAPSWSEVADILPDPRWRQAILDDCEPLHEAVFGLAYADGLPIDEVVRRVGVEAAWVRATQEALREVGRIVVAEDGVYTEGWSPAQVDELLGRIANTAGNSCPGPEGLLTELGRSHAAHCPRCSRAQRLIASGHLSPGAMFPPDDGPMLVGTEIDLLCLQVHPDSLQHARLVLRQLDEHVRVVGGDLLLVNVGAVPDLEERLAALTERAMPRSEHLRGVRRTVRGQWGRRAILGPGVLDLTEAIRHAGWGEIEGVSPLPLPLPPPPSPLRWYCSLLLAMLIFVMAGSYSWTHRAPPAVFAVSADRTAATLTFDTDDDAYVDVIAIDGHLASSLFHSGAPADKGEIATGDGRFAVDSEADVIVVVTSSAPIPPLGGVGELVDDAAALGDAVRRDVPGAGVVILARPQPIRIAGITLHPEGLPWR